MATAKTTMAPKRGATNAKAKATKTTTKAPAAKKKAAPKTATADKAPKMSKATPATTFVPLEQILQSKEIPYRELRQDRVDALAASILKQGLMTPIVTWAGDKSGKVKLKSGDIIDANYLVAGAHRRAALVKLKKQKIAAFNSRFKDGVPVIRMTGTLVDAIMVSLAENVNREEATIVDVMPSIVFLDEKMKIASKDIARRIGLSLSAVQKVLQFNREFGFDKAVELNFRITDIMDALKKLSKLRAEDDEEPDTKKKDKALKAVADKKAKKEAAPERKVGLAIIWQRYSKLPNMAKQRKLDIIEGAILYSLGEADKLPAELTGEA